MAHVASAKKAKHDLAALAEKLGGREPTPEEVSEALGRPVDIVNQFLFKDVQEGEQVEPIRDEEFVSAASAVDKEQGFSVTQPLACEF